MRPLRAVVFLICWLPKGALMPPLVPCGAQCASLGDPYGSKKRSGEGDAKMRPLRTVVFYDMSSERRPKRPLQVPPGAHNAPMGPPMGPPNGYWATLRVD